MKKLFIINSIAALLMVVFFLGLDNLLYLSPAWLPIIFLWPAIVGAITVLIQNKDRSYDYLPKVFIGMAFFSVIAIVLAKCSVYYTENVNISLLKFINPFQDELFIIGSVMYLGGALVGILIRGVNMVFLPGNKYKMSLNISFIKSFLFASLIILGANAYYVLKSIPPDGRWMFQIPATSLFLAVFLLIFFFINKKLIRNLNNNYLIWSYSAMLSLIFLASAKSIETIFQYSEWLYYNYIPFAPYLIIFGLGIIFYLFLALIIEKRQGGSGKAVFLSSLSIIAMIAIPLFAMHFMKASIVSHKEAYINQEIEKAKYCDEDSDCVDAGGQCPFGCYAYVNKNEVGRIGHLISSFDSKCTYGCISCPTAVCENKKCMAECEDGKLY